MHQLLKIAYPGSAKKLVSISCGDGLPATPQWVRNSILEKTKFPENPGTKTRVKKKAARKKEVN
jgi:hypothetical protein